MVDKIVSANAAHKSAAGARRMLGKLAEIDVSVPLIMDLTAEIGQELHDHVQQQATAHAAKQLQPQSAEPPNLVAVSVDGGRIMTRADAGRGVHEQAWKETKNACLQTMSSSISAEDPHPQLPACFSDRTYVEKLVREIHASTTGQAPKEPENADLSEDLRAGVADELRPEPEASSEPACSGNSAPAGRKKESWRPQRLLRTCLSSMAKSDDFGPLVAGEAQRRNFRDDRIADQGNELPSQRDGEILESTAGGGSHPARPSRLALRRRPAQPMDPQSTRFVLLPDMRPTTMMSKEQALHKAERHLSKLVKMVEQAIREGWRVDEFERTSFSELLDMGFDLLTAFVAAQGSGDEGPQVQREGRTFQRLEQPHQRRYVSIYGPLTIQGNIPARRPSSATNTLSCGSTKTSQGRTTSVHSVRNSPSGEKT